MADFVDALAEQLCPASNRPMTSRLEKLAGEYLARIRQRSGGMVAAVEEEYPLFEIQRTAYEYQLEIERNAAHRRRA